MPTSSKEDLIGYIESSEANSLSILGAVFSGIGVFLLALVINTHNSSTLGLLTSLFMLGMGIAFVGAGISSSKKFQAYIQEIESSGELYLLLADFSHSYSMVDDNVRIGEKYIFGKKAGRPASYNDISKVYQSVHKTNFVEDRRHLEAVLTNGKICTLCNLKTGGESDEDVSKIMGYIRYKNTSVHLGYK